LGIDGIYAGKMGMQLTGPKGRNLDYQAPAKLVFLPSGKSAILTAEHPDGVVSLVLKGTLHGATFLAESKGLMDYGGYHYAMKWDVVFDSKKGTATLHGKALNLPKWAKDDDLKYVFTKQRPAKK
jgi:hypothetical protein